MTDAHGEGGPRKGSRWDVMPTDPEEIQRQLDIYARLVAERVAREQPRTPIPPTPSTTTQVTRAVDKILTGYQFAASEESSDEELTDATQLDSNAYLAELTRQDQQRKGTTPEPLVRRIRHVEHRFTGQNSGKSNQDCVLAAMATAGGLKRDELALLFRERFGHEMTSLEKSFPGLANLAGLARSTRSAIAGIVADGGRVFFRAASLSGGGWHAYCGVAVGPTKNTIIAWDPDTSHLDCKEVPIEMIDEEHVYA